MNLAWGNHKRSFKCNGDFIRRRRESLGWTQAELARVSGFTDRLISKAESGRSIAVETINVLAEALSCQQHTIHPEDLVCDPLSLAKEYIAGIYIHQREIMKHIVHFLDENIIFRISGEPEKIPFAGEHRGIQAVDQAFQIFFSVLEVPDGHDHEPHYQFFNVGNEVIVWGQTWIHPIGRPLSKPMPITNRLRFSRGKLVEFDDRFDVAYGEEMLKEA